MTHELRLEHLESKLDTDLHDLTMRVARGFRDVKVQIATEANDRVAKPPDLEPLKLILEKAEHHTERSLSGIKNLQLVLMGLLLLGTGWLTWNQVQLKETLKTHVPTSAQVDLMLKGWEKRREEVAP